MSWLCACTMVAPASKHRNASARISSGVVGAFGLRALVVPPLIAASMRTGCASGTGAILARSGAPRLRELGDVDGALHDTVDEGDPPRADRRHPHTGNDHADEVERIGGVHGDPFALAWSTTHLGELLVGGGQRVLLAAEPADEATAPHQPTVLEPPQRPLQVAPGEPQ